MTQPQPANAPESESAADSPAWARPEAFAAAPAASPWGWIDRRGRQYPCTNAAALADAVRTDHSGIIEFAWSPTSPRLVVPEEIPEISEALLEARKRGIRIDYDALRQRLIIATMAMAAIGIYQLIEGWHRLPPGGIAEKLPLLLRLLTTSTTLGLAVLAWVIFAFIPFYQTWKRRRELGDWSSGRIASLVPAYRFESWLAMQRAPVTWIFIALIAVVYLFQMLAPEGILAAGLVKERYAAGEWWRLFTAPFLHGFLPHVLMNGAAMWYLGRRMEVLARWPHLPLVFLVAAWTGGEFSARLVDAPSVGASGGLMGWLGFLLVFETLHGRLVPTSARRRLLAGVLLTALIGLIGYRFIDNAAHAGGWLAGMFYAWVVFPKSTSPHRPRANATDWIAGGIAMALLLASAGFAVWRLALDWLASH
ncbi:MAG: rhomboid family intramembrane serine protease [Luteolibacter sp.]